MGSHIGFTQTHKRAIHRLVCADCKRKSYFASFFEEWYGWDSTCMNCGRHWQGGEWVPLDFYRYARQNNKEDARLRWRRGIQPSLLAEGDER